MTIKKITTTVFLIAVFVLTGFSQDTQQEKKSNRFKLETR